MKTTIIIMKSVTLTLIYFCSFCLHAQEYIPKKIFPEVEIKATNLSIDTPSKEIEILQNIIKNS